MALNVTFTTLDGREVEYQFTALKRKEAALVFHNTLRVVLSGFAGIGDAEDRKTAFIEALKAFDFESFWTLAKKLLRHCVVKSEKGFIEIRDIDDTDYYEDRPDELYWAVFYAVKANFPKFFSGVMDRLGLSLGHQEPETPNQ